MWNQPPVNASAVASGLLRYPFITCRPAGDHLAHVLLARRAAALPFSSQTWVCVPQIGLPTL